MFSIRLSVFIAVTTRRIKLAVDKDKLIPSETINYWQDGTKATTRPLQVVILTVTTAVQQVYKCPPCI